MANITAELRDGTGKGVARKLRVNGQFPGVIYGAGQPNQNIVLMQKEMVRVLQAEGDHLHVGRHELQLGGRKEVVLVRDVQFHPVNGLPLHIDFLRYDPNKEVEVDVPVHVVGEGASAGIKRGGMAQLAVHSLPVRCKASAIPEVIEVSVAALDIGDAVHLKDLTLPAGVEVATEENFTVVAIVGVKAEAAGEE